MYESDTPHRLIDTYVDEAGNVEVGVPPRLVFSRKAPLAPFSGMHLLNHDISRIFSVSGMC